MAERLLFSNALGLANHSKALKRIVLAVDENLVNGELVERFEGDTRVLMETLYCWMASAIYGINHAVCDYKIHD